MLNYDRTIFESMNPIELPREQLKSILKFKPIRAYELFKLVGLVDSFSDFKRQCKQKSLLIEEGEHLLFSRVDIDTEVYLDNFVDDLLLLKKGKTTYKCIKL